MNALEHAPVVENLRASGHPIIAAAIAHPIIATGVAIGGLFALNKTAQFARRQVNEFGEALSI